MRRRRIVAVTGSASGLGAAITERLRRADVEVIGVDLRDAEVTADLSDRSGRDLAVDTIRSRTDGRLDGLVTCAGVPGLTKTPGSLLASVNHFGAVELLEGLRPLLARGDRPAAVAIASNSMTIQPDVPLRAVESLLEGDEAEARAVADEIGALAMYPATKLALTRWVRRNAPSEDWAGAGVSLNVVAPGPIETPLLDATRTDPTVGAFVDALPTPVGRTARPDEIAALVEFLLGSDARFLCGSVIYADGGLDALLRPDDQPAPWRT